MRRGWIVTAALGMMLSVPAQARAEWQLRPFLGATFGGDTTFVWVGKPNVALGASGGWLGEILGIEGDLSFGPGFFEGTRENLVVGSSVTTLTGNVTIALPRRITEYTLRPYFTGGAGLMHLRVEDALRVLPVSESLTAVDLGGGVTGFLTRRVGVNWDVRHFRTAQRKTLRGLSIGPEQLSFWRAAMGLAIRY